MKSLIVLLFCLPLLFQGAVSAAQQTAPQYDFSEAELEQLLAPVALYPDSLLTHILIASTYPLEIVQAQRWVNRYPDSDSSQLQAIVEQQSWDPSVKALVPFPKILQRMSDDLDWMQKLGDAFLEDEKRVLASIQSLRARAERAGNLRKMENVDISHEQENIIIQPRDPQIVYVPYYDTRLVYGTWYSNHYPPVYWDWAWNGQYHHFYRPHINPFAWYPGIRISVNYYSSGIHWHRRNVLVHGFYSNIDARADRTRHTFDHRRAVPWVHNPGHRRGVGYRNDRARIKSKHDKLAHSPNEFNRKINRHAIQRKSHNERVYQAKKTTGASLGRSSAKPLRRDQALLHRDSKILQRGKSGLRNQRELLGKKDLSHRRHSTRPEQVKANRRYKPEQHQSTARRHGIKDQRGRARYKDGHKSSTGRNTRRMDANNKYNSRVIKAAKNHSVATIKNNQKIK